MSVGILTYADMEVLEMAARFRVEGEPSFWPSELAGALPRRHRTTIYRSLKRLEREGFMASYFRGSPSNRRLYYLTGKSWHV